MRRVCARKGGQQAVAAAAAAVATATTTTTMTAVASSLKKPVITRLDSGHNDRKICSSPLEDNIGGMVKGYERKKRRRNAAVVDVATSFFASLSTN